MIDRKDRIRAKCNAITHLINCQVEEQIALESEYNSLTDLLDSVSYLLDRLTEAEAEIVRLKETNDTHENDLVNAHKMLEHILAERDAAIKDMTEFGNRSTTVPCLICKWYKKGECCDRSKRNCFEWRGAEPAGEGKQ